MYPTFGARFLAGLAATRSRCRVIAILAGFAVMAHAQPAGIAEDAQQLLKASTDFLAGQ